MDIYDGTALKLFFFLNLDSLWSSSKVNKKVELTNIFKLCSIWGPASYS